MRHSRTQRNRKGYRTDREEQRQMKRVQIRQKGERRISAALRIMFVVLLLAAQVAVVILISHVLKQYVAIGYGVLQIISVFLAIHI